MGYTRFTARLLHGLYMFCSERLIARLLHGLYMLCTERLVARRRGESGVVNQISRTVPELGLPPSYVAKVRTSRPMAHCPDCPVDSAVVEQHHAPTVPYS